MQYLDPHWFGDGLKLMEFGMSGGGTMLALSVLLSRDTGKGGGDFFTQNVEPSLAELVGSWSGDKITIAGDYGKPWDGVEHQGEPVNTYEVARARMQNISPMVIEMLLQGGEAVRFQPWMFKEGEEARLQRCLKLLKKCRWVDEDHPALEEMRRVA